MRTHTTLIIFILLSTSCLRSKTPFEIFLSSNPQILIENIETDTSYFDKSKLVWFTQAIDHNNPDKGTFKQRVWLSHSDQQAPVVMVTEGYAANKNYTSELAQLIRCNQIIVEHRYFGLSQPDTIDYQYLSIEQAANDHHKIIQHFNKFYTAKWMTTGISKGGQTAIFHSAFFPDDVDITIPYVAPINLKREDERLINFFKTVGTDEERHKIKSFQKRTLSKREALLPLFEELAIQKNYTFRMGLEKAYDLLVLEYPFAFWQMGHHISAVPSSCASNEVLLNHLCKVSDMSYLADQEWETVKPFFYQAYKELGYYAYDTEDIKDILSDFKEDTISSTTLIPEGDSLTFNPQAMQSIMQNLIKHNPKIIAIIGENDPWSATSIDNTKLSNTIRVIIPKGSHKSRLRNLPDSTYHYVINTLNECLKK